MSIEHGFSPSDASFIRSKKTSKEAGVKVERKESEPTYVEIYELKDKAGKSLCQVQATYLDIAPVMHEELDHKKMRRLQSFQLVKDGNVVDVLEMVGLKKGVRMFVASQTEDSAYYFKPDDRAVVVPQLDHSFGVAIALHELGHAKQFENPFYSKISSTKEVNKHRLLNVKDADLREWCKGTAELFPEMREKLPSEKQLDRRLRLRERLGRLNARVMKWKETSDRLNEKQNVFRNDLEQHERQLAGFTGGQRKKYQESFATYQSKVKQFEHHLGEYNTHIQTISERRNKLVKKIKKIDVHILRVFQIHQKLQERDATRRAFQWMTQINKVLGVDIAGAKVEMPESENMKKPFRKPNGCTESTARVMDNLQKFGGISAKGALLSALGTYDAYEKIPVPTRERLRQIAEEEEKQKS